MGGWLGDVIVLERREEEEKIEVRKKKKATKKNYIPHLSLSLTHTHTPTSPISPSLPPFYILNLNSYFF